MWQSLTHLSIPVLELVIRAAVVYLFVLILLRLAGKKQMSQFGATELVAMLLISNAVQNSMNGGDNSLLGGIILAVALIILSWTISLLTYRSRAFSRLFEGVPTVVIHKGMPIQKNLARERITFPELKSMLRRQGIHSLAEVHTAIVESDGTFSVTRNDELRRAEHGGGGSTEPGPKE